MNVMNNDHDTSNKPPDSKSQEQFSEIENNEQPEPNIKPRRKWAGWICLHRKIMDHPRWMEDRWMRLWITLLLLATHAEQKRKFGDDVITLAPGELITGRTVLEQLTRIPDSTIDRMLLKMVSEQEIEQQTNSKGRWIRIKNWGRYQNFEQRNGQQVGNERATGEQQAGTNNNACSKNKQSWKKKKTWQKRARSASRPGASAPSVGLGLPKEGEPISGGGKANVW